MLVTSGLLSLKVGLATEHYRLTKDCPSEPARTGPVLFPFDEIVVDDS